MPTTTGGLPVQITVTTSIETLRTDLADQALRPAGTADAFAGEGAADLNGQGSSAHAQIPASSARRLACDADILPVVMNSQSQVLDIGRKTRLISPALRLAIELRDQHCRWPDCQANIQEIHHIVFWSNGGSTNQANLAGLCRSHHRSVHERGFTLTGNANGRIDVRGPQ